VTKRKIKILRIIQTLDKTYGGISNAIIDSSIQLKKKGFDVDILTYEKKNDYILSKEKIKVFNKGPAYGKFTFSISLLIWILKNKKNYDLFIIHGLWHFSTLIARFLLVGKYFVFLHGALDPYFSTEIFKSLKKKIYWRFVEERNLLKSISVLLTNEKEKKQLNQTYVNTKKLKKKVVSYGISPPQFKKKIILNKFYKIYPFLKNKKYLLFLGRFHKKKGCEMLINSLTNLSKKNIKIKIVMAGPENKYKNFLQNLARQNGVSSQIFWLDALTGDSKWGAILASQAMILPSNGENFGVSLVESMSCSKAVLTTKKVNIYEEILNDKAGLISQNSTMGITRILLEFSIMNKKAKDKLSKNAIKCFDKNFNINKNINNLCKLIVDSVGKNIRFKNS
tara:strand:- start:5173 stop:6354 length:1182 start_codon:yes stop_codon:yes gene_type:complete